MEAILEKKYKKVSQTLCVHCGDVCSSKNWSIQEKIFCCGGCKLVYEVLHDHNLEQFYQLNEKAGNSIKNIDSSTYEYLDDPSIIEKLISHSQNSNITVWLSLPSIHCSSCLWLLENISRINKGINYSKVNFLEKKALIHFNADKISLRQLVELLTKIGYAPKISLNDSEENGHVKVNKDLYYKLGIAGFAFGNIMLLSFPEYLGLGEFDGKLSYYIRYVNVALILPVIFYCAKEYLESARQGLIQRHLNIDTPISLGILALFFKSLFDIFSGAGPGYLDSLAGLIFFLLIGKWFQSFTFNRIKFDLDYKSYFPIAASLVENNTERKIGLKKIAKGNVLRVRHGEIIPADGLLQSEKAKIDYSFVTGESEAISISNKSKVYCGGKVVGEMIEVLVQRTVNTSYLTQLWNESAFDKKKLDSNISIINEKVAKYFTFIIILISLLSFIFHSLEDFNKGLHVFSTVLIIACPCAIALSMPFTFGNLIRIFSQKNIFFKNIKVIEDCSRIETIVFDKTGTITQVSKSTLQYVGMALNPYQERLIASLANNSIHTLSKAITELFDVENYFQIQSFEEINGKGIQGIVDGHRVKVGSRKFLMHDQSFAQSKILQNSNIFIEIDNQIIGSFKTTSKFRNKLSDLLNLLNKDYKLNLISGDKNNDENQLNKLFPRWENLLFQKSPFDKLNFIKEIQLKNQHVAMIGDGLNDAGALRQSDVGISITEDTSNFTPACDIIIGSENFTKIPLIFDTCKKGVKLIYISYGIAIIYNLIGICFAVQGLLSPVIAAILMPLSSITVVLIGFISSTILFKSHFD